jgi:hypothetical protein
VMRKKSRSVMTLTPMLCNKVRRMSLTRSKMPLPMQS